jgi:hypothetical protein
LLSACQQFLLVPASKQIAVSVWHMPVAVRTVLSSWWWTERPPETCRVSFQNKIIWYIGASGWFYYRKPRIKLAHRRMKWFFGDDNSIRRYSSSAFVIVDRMAKENWLGLEAMNVKVNLHIFRMKHISVLFLRWLLSLLVCEI